MECLRYVKTIWKWSWTSKINKVNLLKILLEGQITLTDISDLSADKSTYLRLVKGLRTFPRSLDERHNILRGGDLKNN